MAESTNADRRRDPFASSRRNAALGWALLALLCVLAVVHVSEAAYRWFVFTGLAVTIVFLPVLARRDPLALPSWELLALVSIPVLDASILGQTFVTDIAVYVAVAAVALVVVAEIHCFTAVRMTQAFAIALVVMTTLAVAATWNVLLWLSDTTIGTSYIATGQSEDAANHEMMVDFVYAAIAGLVAGVIFDRYVMDESTAGSSATRSSADADESAPDAADAGAGTGVTGRAADPTGADASGSADPDVAASVPSLIRGRLNVPERTVRRVSRVLQATLGALFLYGFLTRDVTTIANAGIALSITVLPGLLERDLRLPLEPELVLWLTGAVFLHALGSAGLYDLLGPWDNLTHAVSASIVAATGYATVRAIDLHTDDVYLPPKMLFVFILLFVLAFGVLWELFEFGLGLLAERLGTEVLLAQHGITDTIGDLFYALVGALVVAIWGTVYLTAVSYRIADLLGDDDQ